MKFHFFSSIQGYSFCITLLETCFANTRQHVLTCRPVNFLPKNGNSGVEILCEVWSSFTFNVSSPVSEPNGYKFIQVPRELNTIVKINHLIRRRWNDMILSNRRFAWYFGWQFCTFSLNVIFYWCLIQSNLELFRELFRVPFLSTFNSVASHIPVSPDNSRK